MTESDGRRKHGSYNATSASPTRGGCLMARRRVYPAGYRNMDISSRAYGTGIVQLLASGYQRWLNFARFTWDGQHRDERNRPLLLMLTDEIMQPDESSSFYPCTVVQGSQQYPTVSVAIEGRHVKLTASGRTDSLYIGLFYFGTQFV